MERSRTRRLRFARPRRPSRQAVLSRGAEAAFQEPWLCLSLPLLGKTTALSRGLVIAVMESFRCLRYCGLKSSSSYKRIPQSGTEVRSPAFQGWVVVLALENSSLEGRQPFTPRRTKSRSLDSSPKAGSSLGMTPLSAMRLRYWRVILCAETAGATRTGPHRVAPAKLYPLISQFAVWPADCE